jgi:acetoacetyl-CoA synthetase
MGDVGEASVLADYLRWLCETRGLEFDGYDALWAWSVDNVDEFWVSVTQFFGIDLSVDVHTTAVRAGDGILDCHWFPGGRTNYAQLMLRHTDLDSPAVLAYDETGPVRTVSWPQLRGEVGAAAAWLSVHGVRRGDRVVAYLSNRVEALIGLLACASIGAIWSSCSPEYGAPAAIDRFAQLEPVVLLAGPRYQFGGRAHDRSAQLRQIRAALPTLRHVVLVTNDGSDGDSKANGDGGSADTTFWRELIADPREPVFELLPFEHPLWIVFSSGTTGTPKGIVHGHGGIVLEQLKFLGMHLDIRPGRRFAWYSSTSWIMWNILVSALLHGATVVLYDGSPGWPEPDRLWRLAAEARLQTLGTSAAYLSASERAGLRPAARHDLSGLRTVGVTGSPLPASAAEWLRREVGSDTWIANQSGGTDVASAFAGSVPILGECQGALQGRALGVRMEAWDGEGRAVRGEVGELVVTLPMPSMPVGFWNDPDRSRYAQAYFETYPGVWRHGDWVRIETDGSVSVLGRSDATINRQGVRVGSAEVYNVLDRMPQLADSLLVGVERPAGEYWLALFMVLRDGAGAADSGGDRKGDGGGHETLMRTIRQAIRTEVSPRHVPDDMILVPRLPRTLTGKRVELPVKRLLQGMPAEQAASLSALDDPESFLALARDRLVNGV